ncbi:hypothetical protein K431DRAFT_280833 [Polychaeton citri CBS 116435]|uniref:F-box domain-containing protein n=1 Tax=Polychaeton citri CBS 116435 TaxID=1314669 RepID=A0A9P4UUT7_9PEZI|nr:hypothetical protein K431DRAFT_280833 [Polychaeton citri CBS 116435]
MAATSFSRVPIELVERFAQYLDPSDLMSFRTVCKQADVQTFQTVAQQFFSDLKCSLMGSDIQRLEGISRHEDLRRFVKTLRIEDDSQKHDPWSASEPPPAGSSYIWPRDDGGLVDRSRVSTEGLKTMLAEQRLRPETITFRDYRAEASNLLLFPETSESLDCRIAALEPITVLARNVIGGADLGVVSLDMRNVDIPLSRKSILHSPDIAQGKTQVSLGGPTVKEVMLELLPQHQGQGIGFSTLRSAKLCLTSNIDLYWLEQVLCNAPNLEDLQLSVANLWDHMLPADGLSSNLKQLDLSSATLQTRNVLSVLANSKDSLTGISLRHITLSQGQGSSWRELLSMVGNDYPRLTSFHVMALKEGTTNSTNVNFLGFDKNAVAEENRSGLRAVEKGHAGNRRLTRVQYDGPNAGSVMRSLAAYAG